MTVVPLTEPPVGTRGLPLAIFFFLLMLGSSQLPQAGDVVENARAYCNRFAALTTLACFCMGARNCRKDDAPLKVKPWKALTRADAFEGFIMTAVGRC